MADTMPSPRPATIGVDVSRWQGVVDYKTFAPAKIMFSVAKACHGAGMDPTFATNWRTSGEHGVIRGAYTWYVPDSASSATKQAEYFWSALEKAGYTALDMPPAVDFEHPVKMPASILLGGLFEFLERVIVLSGRRPLMYTGSWYWQQYVGNLDSEALVAICDLWHSEYPRLASTYDYEKAVQGLKSPTLPRPWKVRGIPATLHQFDGDKGLVLPQKTDADFNVFWGDLIMFKDWIARSSDPSCRVQNFSAVPSGPR